jgi:hypothetical protein
LIDENGDEVRLEKVPALKLPLPPEQSSKPTAIHLAAIRAAEGRYNMKRHLKYRRILTLGFVLLLAGALSAQRSPDKKLLVNRKSTSEVVLQVEGRSYIDIEILAQITNG